MEPTILLENCVLSSILLVFIY